MRKADGMVLGMILEPGLHDEFLCVLAHESTLTSILGQLPVL
jgi:hypothetical protein